MKNRLLLVAVACGALFTTATMADTFNKKTKLTFSGPVQVPGVTLPAGTYVFKLVDSSSNRNIVQVMNASENKTYATVIAIPDYRINATSKTVMYFSERKSNAPMAVKSWFYPGDNFGQRFVYPKVKAVEIAAATNQPVPSHTVEVVERTKYVEVPVYVQTPAKQEVAYAPAQFDKVDATDTAGVDGEPVKEAPAAAAAPAAKLPKTASPIHLAGGLGALLIGASLLARSLRARVR
jgi:hypothetical protein